MLGKGQEVTRLLTDAGIPVLQHRDIFAVSQVYEACGMSLGQYERFTGEAGRAGRVRRAAGPGKRGQSNLRKRPAGGSTNWTGPLFPRQVRIAVTGWAVDQRAKYRFGVDHAMPLVGPCRLRRIVRGGRAGRAAGGVLHARPGEFRRLAPRRRPRRPAVGQADARAAVLNDE